MNKPDQSALELEWVTLQNQYDSYEKHALFIKLFSMFICTIMFFHNILDFLFVALLLLAWLLEGIWKTFQSRITTRILKVEASIAHQTDCAAMQFHTDWLANRAGLGGLIAEYIKNCLAPTVLVPHGIIVSVGIMAVLVF